MTRRRPAPRARLTSSNGQTEGHRQVKLVGASAGPPSKNSVGVRRDRLGYSSHVIPTASLADSWGCPRREFSHPLGAEDRDGPGPGSRQSRSLAPDRSQACHGRALWRRLRGFEVMLVNARDASMSPAARPMSMTPNGCGDWANTGCCAPGFRPDQTCAELGVWRRQINISGEKGVLLAPKPLKCPKHGQFFK